MSDPRRQVAPDGAEDEPCLPVAGECGDPAQVGVPDAVGHLRMDRRHPVDEGSEDPWPEPPVRAANDDHLIHTRLPCRGRRRPAADVEDGDGCLSRHLGEHPVSETCEPEPGRTAQLDRPTRLELEEPDGSFTDPGPEIPPVELVSQR